MDYSVRIKKGIYCYQKSYITHFYAVVNLSCAVKVKVKVNKATDLGGFCNPVRFKVLMWLCITAL